MKFFLLCITLITFNIAFSQQDIYKIIVDGKEVFINTKTGERINNKSNYDKQSANFAKENYELYRVKKGDTYYSIARKNGITLKRLYELNAINKEHALLVGTTLFLKENARKQTNSTSLSSSYHIVNKGDTLFSIAKRYNTTVDQLLYINNLGSNAIFIKQRVRIK